MVRLNKDEPVIPMTVLFFKTDSGNQPVKECLREFQPIDKKAMLEDSWPLGTPLVSKMDTDLWEIRVTISSGIVRIFLL